MAVLACMGEWQLVCSPESIRALLACMVEGQLECSFQLTCADEATAQVLTEAVASGDLLTVAATERQSSGSTMSERIRRVRLFSPGFLGVLSLQARRCRYP